MFLDSLLVFTRPFFQYFGFFIFIFAYCGSALSASFSSACFLPKGTVSSDSRSLCSSDQAFLLDHLKAVHVKQTSAVPEQIQWGCESPSLKCISFCFIFVYCGLSRCLGNNKMFEKSHTWVSCTGNDGSTSVLLLIVSFHPAWSLNTVIYSHTNDIDCKRHYIWSYKSRRKREIKSITDNIIDFAHKESGVLPV